jgi:hypothetical protein
MSLNDRISFDTASSGVVQDDVAVIVGQLEALMAARDGQVNRAMSDFQADGVSEDYHAVEQRWQRASDEVRMIIELVKSVLSRNDETAASAQARARSAIQNIG